MTQQEFISLTEREVFAEMLRNINELFGQSKSASLFISLFSSVRCKIVLQQYNDLSVASKKMQLDDLVNSVTTNMEGNDIVFRFFYKDEKHLKHLHKVSVKYHMYFTYQYFKHVHSLMSLTTSTAHQAAMFRLVANKEHPFYLIDLMNLNKSDNQFIGLIAAELFVKYLLLQDGKEISTGLKIVIDKFIGTYDESSYNLKPKEKEELSKANLENQSELLAYASSYIQ